MSADRKALARALGAHPQDPALRAERAAAIVEALDADGWRLIRKDTVQLLARVAEVALTPDGSHTLIDGYCPDCQGGCLWFDPEPVPYVGPDPFGPVA